MEFEVGQRWVTRGGQVAVITEVYDGPLGLYNQLGRFTLGRRQWSLYPNGIFHPFERSNDPEYTHDNDLMHLEESVQYECGEIVMATKEGLEGTLHINYGRA